MVVHAGQNKIFVKTVNTQNRCCVWKSGFKGQIYTQVFGYVTIFLLCSREFFSKCELSLDVVLRPTHLNL